MIRCTQYRNGECKLVTKATGRTVRVPGQEHVCRQCMTEGVNGIAPDGHHTPCVIDMIAAAPAVQQSLPVVQYNSGIGTEVERLLKADGFRESSGCSCASLRRELDSIAPDVVEARIEKYARKLIDNYSKAGGWEAYSKRITLKAAVRQAATAVAGLVRGQSPALAVASDYLRRACAKGRPRSLPMVHTVPQSVQDAAAVAMADRIEAPESPANVVALVPLFNPLGWTNRWRNYDRVIGHFRRLGFRQVLTIEAVYPGQHSHATGDAIVIPATDNQVMFQKERLMNIGLDSLRHSPPFGVAWLDADLLWDKPIGPLVEQGLRSHEALHLFATCTLHRADDSIESGRCGQFAPQPADGHLPRNIGMAWAARWETIAGRGFFDTSIVGSGDRFMLHGWEHHSWPTAPASMREGWLQWWPERPLSIGFVDAHCCHLWHGSIPDRQYEARHEPLEELQFSPSNDIRIADNGLWEWTGRNPKLAATVREHLQSRREDR